MTVSMPVKEEEGLAFKQPYRDDYIDMSSYSISKHYRSARQGMIDFSLCFTISKYRQVWRQTLCLLILAQDEIFMEPVKSFSHGTQHVSD